MNRVPASPGSVFECDYRAVIGEQAEGAPHEVSLTAKCGACAAEFAFGPDAHAGSCPFCGTKAVTDSGRARAIRPNGMLPFTITGGEARARFRQWLGSLWLAPPGLARNARRIEALTGTYVPHWTFDCATASRYRGQRGDFYRVPVLVTVRVDGRPVQRTRWVTKVRWTPASGRVARRFDDLLVLASKALPRRLISALAPWDLAELVPPRDEYMSGFRSEVYGLDLEAGFEQARARMDEIIRDDVRSDIGGDQQRIADVDTRYDDVRFKLILLPIWISAFRYRGKSYRFVVNGRSGEVGGERPYSTLKIVGLALLALALAGGALWLLASHPELLEGVSAY